MSVLCFFKNLKKETKYMIATAIILIIVFGGISLSRFIQLGESPRVIDSNTIVSKFEAINELATAKVTYQGITEVREEHFFGDEVSLMLYTSDVIASVDLSKAEVDVNEAEKIINIKIPEASEPEININMKSIEWKDVSFNELDGTEHMQVGLKQAREECLTKIAETDLMENATANAVLSIKNLFAGLTQEKHPYTINVEVIKNVTQETPATEGQEVSENGES